MICLRKPKPTKGCSANGRTKAKAVPLHATKALGGEDV
jgi:hypothetical protein